MLWRLSAIPRFPSYPYVTVLALVGQDIAFHSSKYTSSLERFVGEDGLDHNQIMFAYLAFAVSVYDRYPAKLAPFGSVCHKNHTQGNTFLETDVPDIS